MKMTSLSYAPTPSKLIMVSRMMRTIVFAFFFLRPHLILSRTRKSGSNFSPVFSQSNITVVPPLAYVILAPMKLYLLAPSAKPTDTNLMGRHHKLIFNIFPLSHGCVPWFRTYPTPKECDTGRNTNTTLRRSQIFSMVLITVHFWRLLSLSVMKNFPCGSSLIPGISRWDSQQTALAPSRSATRLLGPLSFSITIFHLKNGFGKKTLSPLGQYLVPRNLPTWILSYGHWSRSYYN